MGWFGPSGDCGCCGNECNCTTNPDPACNEYYDDGGSVLKTQKVASVTIANVINQAAANCDNCTFLNDTFLFTPCVDTTYFGETVLCDGLSSDWVRTCVWITGKYDLSIVGSNLFARLTITITSSNNAGSSGPDPRPAHVSCTSGAGGATDPDTRTWVYEKSTPLIDALRYSDCDDNSECEDMAAETFETYPEVTSLDFVSETDSALFNKFACDISSSTCSVSLV